MLAQGATGRITHDEIRHSIHDAEIQHAYDIGMLQARNCACLIAKLLQVLATQMRIKHFDGRQGIEVDMLSQIDISETAAPKQMKQAIIPKLLSCTIGHACTMLPQS